MNVRTTLRDIRTAGPSLQQVTALIAGLNVMLKTRQPAPEDTTDDTIVYYFEHYPHYTGTLNVDLEIPFGKLKELQSAIADDDYDVIAEDIFDPEGKTVHALENIFDDNCSPLEDLRKTGTWAGQWEEGSFALSVISLKEARSACALVETQLTEDEDDCTGL